MNIFTTLAIIDQGVILRYQMSTDVGDVTVSGDDYDSFVSTGSPSTDAITSLNAWLDAGNEPSVQIIGGGGLTTTVIIDDPAPDDEPADDPVPDPEPSDTVTDPDLPILDEATGDDANELFLPTLNNMQEVEGHIANASVEFLTVGNATAEQELPIGDDANKVITQVAVKINTPYTSGTLKIGDATNPVRYLNGAGEIELSTYNANNVIAYFPYITNTDGEQPIVTLEGTAGGSATVFIHSYR